MGKFAILKSILSSSGSTNGQIRKNESDQIMDITWNEDIQSKKCYIYDYFHDDQKHKIKGYDPSVSETKTPIDAKFIITQYGTVSKDQVEYHIQFRPFQKCPLDYYKSEYEDKYLCEYPLGLYIDIPDDEGVYRKWLIVSYDTANQFRKYSVLPCNFYFTWVMNGTIYGMCGTARLRNSYNSGLWTDYRITTVENQDQIWFPLNSITENIYYIDEESSENQRFIISPPVKHPNTWKVSKLESLHPIGIYKVTLYQSKFNPLTDMLIKLPVDAPEEDKIPCWVADYNKSSLTPTPPPVIEKDDNSDYCKIQYSGNSPQVKVNGGYKKISVLFFNKNNIQIDKYLVDETCWSFIIDNIDVSDLIDIKLISEDSFNEIKIKFLGDETYLSKILTVGVKDTTDTVKSTVQLEIVCL